MDNDSARDGEGWGWGAAAAERTVVIVKKGVGTVWTAVLNPFERCRGTVGPV